MPQSSTVTQDQPSCSRCCACLLGGFFSWQESVALSAACRCWSDAALPYVLRPVGWLNTSELGFGPLPIRGGNSVGFIPGDRADQSCRGMGIACRNGWLSLLVWPPNQQHLHYDPSAAGPAECQTLISKLRIHSQGRSAMTVARTTARLAAAERETWAWAKFD